MTTPTTVPGPSVSPGTTPGPDTTTQPGESPDTTTRPGEAPDTTTRPEEAPDTTTRPGEAPDTTTRPGEAPDTTTRPGEAPDTTTRPGEAPDTTTRPGEAPDTTTRPEEAPDTTTRPGEAPDTTTRPEEAPDTTTRPGEAPDTTTRPEEAPDTTTRPGESPDTTTRPGEAPDISTQTVPISRPETTVSAKSELEEIQAYSQETPRTAPEEFAKRETPLPERARADVASAESLRHIEPDDAPEMGRKRTPPRPPDTPDDGKKEEEKVQGPDGSYARVIGHRETVRYTYDNEKDEARAERVAVQEQPDVLKRDSTPPQSTLRQVGALDIIPSGREVQATRDDTNTVMGVPEEVARRLREESERTGKPASTEITYEYTHDIDERRTTVEIDAGVSKGTPAKAQDDRSNWRLRPRSETPLGRGEHGSGQQGKGQKPQQVGGGQGKAEAEASSALPQDAAPDSGLVSNPKAASQGTPAKAQDDRGNWKLRPRSQTPLGAGASAGPGQKGGGFKPRQEKGRDGALSANKNGLVSKAEAEERRRLRLEREGALRETPEYSPAKPGKFGSGKKKKSEPWRSPGRTTVIVNSMHGGASGPSRPSHFRPA